MWNKYRSEIITQPKNNHFEYILDLPIRNINRLFALSFKAGENSLMRNSIVKYHIPLIEIKDLNVLIDNKPFFKQLAKNKEETYEKIMEMSRNNDYITRNLLDYYYKLIGIDLSRQTNTTIYQQINFTGKLEEDDRVKIFFITEKEQRTILNFSFKQ